MRFLKLISEVYWSMSRWTYRSEPAPKHPSGLLVSAPHTSNWDFVLMLAVAWKSGLRPKFLGKKELFRGPMGPVMRLFGGIPVDRANPAGLIDDLARRMSEGEEFQLVITPEGTRGKVERWKSGFYRLAQQTGLPVTLAYCDRNTMTSGLGPEVPITGNVKADMDRIREYYEGKTGVNPENGCEPRLAEE